MTTETHPQTSSGTTVQDLPNHILELILLRINSSPCLAWAAATCWRWYRLIADDLFLTRLVLDASENIGEYHNVGGRTIFVPSSPVAASLSSHFSLDSFQGNRSGNMNKDLCFLPDSDEPWNVVDSRGCLLLVSNMKTWRSVWDKRDAHAHSGELIVCEPLTRRYRWIWKSPRLIKYCMFLVHGKDAHLPISLSNFNVISTTYRGYESLIFSNGNIHRHQHPDMRPRWTFDYNNFVGRANGFMYWGIQGEVSLLALEETTSKFHTHEFPESIWGAGTYNKTDQAIRIVGGKDSALRFVRVIENELKVFTLPQGNERWVVEMELYLPEATTGLPGRDGSFFQSGPARIINANNRYIVLAPHERSTWIFTVDLRTKKVECKHQRNKHYGGETFVCEFPWPIPTFDLV